MRIEWSARARTDLRDLQAYIAKDSEFYARRFVARIIGSVEKLSDQPHIGRRVPEASERDDVRELLFQNYRIIYLVRPDAVSVVTVVHGGRDLSRRDRKPWDVT